MTIKNVVLAGANGNIGTAVLDALGSFKEFNVTIIARSGSKAKATLSEDVKLITVDYSDSAKLAAALKDQDAVVSALHHSAADQQRALLDASVAAGVKRFIPSEFGSDTLNPKSAPLPVFAGKKEMQQYIEGLAAEGKISYTYVINGPFLDWGLSHGSLGLDLKKRQLSYVDDGNAAFSTTTLATIGRAVAGVLKHPDETKNRAVYIQDAALTAKSLLELAKQALGAEGWTEVDSGTSEGLERANYEKLAQGHGDESVYLGYLTSAVFREGYGGHFQKLDNNLLEIAGLSEQEIVELIKDVAKHQAA